MVRILVTTALVPKLAVQNGHCNVEIRSGLSWLLLSCLFHGSVEVLADQLLEEDAEAPGPAKVLFVYLGPHKFLCLISQRDHYFSHGSSRLLEIAPVAVL